MNDLHPVTKLPNINVFYEQFNRKVAPTSGAWGIIILDVRATQIMNETLGYTGTDLILKGIGESLQETSKIINGNVLVTHFFDDKFTILASIPTLGALEETAKTLVKGLKEASIFANVREEICAMHQNKPIPMDMILSMSVGVAMWKRGQHVRCLLDEGMTALAMGKEEGRVGHKTATPRSLGIALSELIKTRGIYTDVDQVKTIVKKGADLNEPHLHRTPLMWAMFTQHRKLVDYLFRQPFDPLKCDESDNSYLMITMKLHKFSYLTPLLLQKEFDPAQSNDEGENAVFLAVKNGRKELLESLFQANAPLDEPTAKHMTPLKEAIHRNRKDMCEMLLHAKANPNACGGSATPVQLAAHLGRNKCLELLLSYGADAGRSTERVKESPIQLAAYSGMSRMVPMLSPYALIWEQPILAELGKERYDIYDRILRQLSPKVSPGQELDVGAFMTLVRTGNTKAANYLFGVFSGSHDMLPEQFEVVCKAPGARRLKRYALLNEIQGNSMVPLLFSFIFELFLSLIFPFFNVLYVCFTSHDYRLKDNYKFHLFITLLLVPAGWFPASAYAFLLGWYSPDFFTTVQKESSSGTRGFLLSMFTLSYIFSGVLVWPWTFVLDSEDYFLCGIMTATGLLIPYFARRLKIMFLGFLLAAGSIIPWSMALDGEDMQYVVPLFWFILSIPCFYMLPVLLWAVCFSSVPQIQNSMPVTVTSASDSYSFDYDDAYDTPSKRNPKTIEIQLMVPT